MKALLIATVIFLILLGSTKVQAKVDGTADIDFQARISEIAKTHRILMDKMIAYVEFKHESINLLAEVIYHENWFTDKEKKTAYWTGAVVMNRVKSPKFPNTVKEVLYQKNPIQYSTTGKFFTKEIPEECYEMARDIWENGTPDVPENVLYQATFKQGKIWEQKNGEIFCYG